MKMTKQEFEAKFEALFEEIAKTADVQVSELTEEEAQETTQKICDKFVDTFNLFSKYLSDMISPMSGKMEPWWAYVLHSFSGSMVARMDPPNLGMLRNIHTLLDDAPTIEGTIPVNEENE